MTQTLQMNLNLVFIFPLGFKHHVEPQKLISKKIRKHPPARPLWCVWGGEVPGLTPSVVCFVSGLLAVSSSANLSLSPALLLGGKEAGMNFVQTHTFTAVIMSPAPFRDTTSLHFVEKKTVALCLNVERTQDHWILKRPKCVHTQLSSAGCIPWTKDLGSTGRTVFANEQSFFQTQ